MSQSGYLKQNVPAEPFFSTLLTEEAPQPAPRFEGDGVRVRYLGHACVLLEAKGVSILCDPMVSYKYDGEVHSNQLVEACRRRGLTAELLYGHKEVHLS